MVAYVGMGVDSIVPEGYNPALVCATEEHTDVSASSSSSLKDISQGQKLEGTVKKVTLSGAIVDVGAEVEGLLHISDLGQKQVSRVSSILTEGQQIAVWVKRVDLVGGRLSLTMVEPARYTWGDLKPGLKTEGKVVRVEKFGAFVDIGADTDGLVHISEMGVARGGKPTEVVSEGDVVEVWVKDADRKSKRISLTMHEPPAVDLRTLKPDAILSGKVVRLESFGAFVDVGAGRDGMIHISEMGDNYVGSPSEVLSVGDQVQVRVLEVDSRRGRIALSMKDLPTEQYAVEPDAEEMPSSMELALREAMEGREVSTPIKQAPARRQKSSRQPRASVQDEIIARTLRSHQG